MALLEAIVGPISKLLDKIIPDQEARDRAKLELIRLQGDQEMEAIGVQMQAIVAEAQSSDPWTSRARPPNGASTSRLAVSAAGSRSMPINEAPVTRPSSAAAWPAPPSVPST